MAARKFPLEKPVTTIGRSSMNDLPISDKMLSRQHARIVKDDDGGLVVEDLGSRNGTFLNGDRLAIPQPLKAGDRITLGGVTLKLESESTTRVRIEAGGADALDNTILKASAELLRAQHQETDPRRPARASRSPTRSDSPGSSRSSPRRSRTKARWSGSFTSTARWAIAPSRKRTCAS